ncbi:hypothetical protein ACFL21_05280 [Patescibacteria group bacterium]
MKKLSIKAAALSVGITWALFLLMVSLGAKFFDIWTGFTTLIADIYIGYELTYAGIAIGMIYAFIDLSIGAAIMAGLYNYFAK